MNQKTYAKVYLATTNSFSFEYSMAVEIYRQWELR